MAAPIGAPLNAVSKRATEADEGDPGLVSAGERAVLVIEHLPMWETSAYFFRPKNGR